MIILGLIHGDFENATEGIRHGLFQVVSIVTTTGYGTDDFDSWNHFSRGLLLLLMFVGGCAGSTGGGMKVIRHVLFVKILGMELEHSFHPKVVRLLRIGGKPVEDESLRHTILVYFALIFMLFVIGFLFVILIEPNETWGVHADNKLIDTGSAVAATLNNIGPGLGTVGATQNYGHFGVVSKSMFIFLMMLGAARDLPCSGFARSEILARSITNHVGRTRNNHGETCIAPTILHAHQLPGVGDGYHRHVFHDESGGYEPGLSAGIQLAVTRKLYSKNFFWV